MFYRVDDGEGSCFIGLTIDDGEGSCFIELTMVKIVVL